MTSNPRAMASGGVASALGEHRPDRTSASKARRYSGIVESIGDTPTIEIPRLAPSPDVRLFAKLEAANPTGSIKDRVARALIEDLEAKGRLHPGSIILEATSGNTGIALAMIGRRKGYRVAVVMPDNVTLERRQLVALHGAEVIDSPGASGSNGAIALARELVARDPQFVMADQYAYLANPRVHEETDRSGDPRRRSRARRVRGRVGYGWDADGRWTVPAAGQARRANCKSRAAPRRGGPGPPLARRRVRAGDLRPDAPGRPVRRGEPDAVETARELLEREGVLAGPSSGAILWVAARVAETMERGTIVALLPDGGWKYLSTGTYARPLDEMEDELEGGVAWW